MTPPCLVNDSDALEELACTRRIYTLLIQDVETERHFICPMGSPTNMFVPVALMFQNKSKNSRLINPHPAYVENMVKS